VVTRSSPTENELRIQIAHSRSSSVMLAQCYAIGAEVDVLRDPLVALPQLVELLRLEQLQLARLLLGSKRPRGRDRTTS
jgi:hypothetical protein